MEEMKDGLTMEQVRDMLYKLIDIINFYHFMSKTSSCNDCDRVRYCEYAPDPGKQVRYNCMFWEGRNEEVQSGQNL